MITKRKDIKINPESTWLRPSIKTKEELINWVLVSLGYDLVTVELTEEQLNLCIQNALEKYTKYAYFPEKEVVASLSRYVINKGLDLSHLNIVSIRDISFARDNMLAINSDIFFGAPQFFIGGGGYPFFGNGCQWAGSFTSYHNLHEFFDLTKRMTGSNPDWNYDVATKTLKLYPEPRCAVPEGTPPNKEYDKKCECILMECEVEPPLSELYGNEYVKRLTLAYAKILLGTVRSKFQNVQLPGGGTVNTEIGNEGREELDKIMENIRTDESKGNCCFIV